ncbi:MAG TPA: hypothetical protein VFM54_24310 [Micromonosporaceae bacterium]|nr:hypothetical protein [Micromonosporaceae bacterium]
MPASGRGHHLLAGAGIRASAGLLPAGPAGPTWPGLLANALWGGQLTVVADPDRARTRVELYWPGVRTAQVVRVDAGGTEHPVRGGEPALVCTGWARYDHEAPLDQAVTYRATSDQATGAQCSSAPVALASQGRAWLKHPTRPHLSRVVAVREMRTRAQAARRGVARPEDRPDPVVVHQVRATSSGSVLLQTDGTWADQTALAQLLADGAPLLLQTPATRGGESLYISVDTTDVDPLDPMLGTELLRRFVLPFDTLERPPGQATGPADAQYAGVATAYHTYGAVPAGEATHLDLAMTPGP